MKDSMKDHDVAIVFTGHMTDLPTRPTPRFPLEMVKHAAEEIHSAIADEWFKANWAVFISSGARGADIIAGELTAKKMMPHHMVFPHDIKTFRRNSIGKPDNYCWERRLDTLISLAERAEYLPGDGSYDDYHKANLRMLELAEELAEEVVVIAFWDGKEGGVGGTGHFLNVAREKGHRIKVINCERVLADYQHSLGLPS
jgi:hypothetical protein